MIAKSCRFQMKEGELDMSKILYLYLKSKHTPPCENYKDIYYFNNNKILAVDVDKYRSKESRFNLQKNFNGFPYPLSSKVFNEFIIYAINNPTEILLLDILFCDDSIEDEIEVKSLRESLLSGNYYEAFNTVQEIILQYDTEVKGIVFRYKGFQFKMTNQGVIEVDSSQEVFRDFLQDKKINRLILGLNG